MSEGSILKFNIADQKLVYRGRKISGELHKNEVIDFNHRHARVMDRFRINLKKGTIFTISDGINGKSNLGVFRNRQLREAVILSAALPALAVGLHGFGSFSSLEKSQQTKETLNNLKRDNDRTAAQIMGEVFQITADSLPLGEEVVIESAITEGVRVKVGVETGANPTIAVGTLYGKEEHKKVYGHSLDPSVVRLSMGNDVIDGTGKSVKGLHSSLTAVFVTESHIKRHLPDIYVQRWASGAYFPEVNPRETTDEEFAKIIAGAYGLKNTDQLSAFFLDRQRHNPIIDRLHKLGTWTPYDKDGDLFPGVVMGLSGLEYPNGIGLHSMIGEIGGSAEWVVGALPLVWRGGQEIGALTSQSMLTRKDLAPETLWKERFSYTEEEFMLIQDTRFEQKPYFTLDDIMENPFAGGVSAFGAISDNYHFPGIDGVSSNPENNEITVNTLVINSLGIVEHWELIFGCQKDLNTVIEKITSPKEKLEKLSGASLEKELEGMLAQEDTRETLKIFFTNEYYSVIIPVAGKMFLLNRSVDNLIEKDAFSEKDREIIEAGQRLAPEWFTT